MIAAPGALMAAEIAEQPEALARLLERGADPIADAAGAIAAGAPRHGDSPWGASVAASPGGHAPNGRAR